jgi:hypothetical protein
MEVGGAREGIGRRAAVAAGVVDAVAEMVAETGITAETAAETRVGR